jgi:hypothetical protein
MEVTKDGILVIVIFVFYESLLKGFNDSQYPQSLL